MCAEADPVERLEIGRRGWLSNPLVAEHACRYVLADRLLGAVRVLDVACGSGYGSWWLARRAARNVVGADLSLEAIGLATELWSRHNLAFVQASAVRLPFADASFGAAVSFETIEHLDEPRDFVEELHRVLRPGGTLIISTPDKAVYNWADHRSDGGNPFHLSEMTVSEFRELVSTRFAIRRMYEQALVPAFPEPASPLRRRDLLTHRSLRLLSRVTREPLGLLPSRWPPNLGLCELSFPQYRPREWRGSPAKYVVIVASPRRGI